MADCQKRILHLSHTDIRSDSRILKAMQVGVDLGCKVTGFGLELDESAASSSPSSSVEIRTLRLFGRRLTWAPRAVRHLFSLVESFVRIVPIALKGRPHIVHCHDVLMLPLSSLVALISGARLVYDAHELESNRNGLSPQLGAVVLWVERRLWGVIDLLIVVSPSIERWYQENVGQKKSIVVMNSPESGSISARSESYLRDKFNIPSTSVIFIYVGLLSQGRGIELVLEAFARNRESAALVFLGYGDYQERISEISRASNSNVFLHPPVPHADVVSVVRSADVGICLIENVSLSDYFSLPNKLFEYAFSDVLVLASNFPDIADMVSRYRLGICADLEVESISKAMADVTGKIGALGRADLSEISWSAQSSRLSCAYGKLISGG